MRTGCPQDFSCQINTGMISLGDNRKEVWLMRFTPKEIILKNGQKCTIRRFEKKDAKAVSALIAYTLRTTNRADYSEEYLEKDIQCLQPENLISRAEVQHFYVAEDDNRIVGCGSIGSYLGKEDESSLFTIFVHPDQQGKGLGQASLKPWNRMSTHCGLNGLRSLHPLQAFHSI